MITWDDFKKVDMQVGTIMEAVVFEEVKVPAYRLRIDFGDKVLKSSAQITELYSPKELIGRQIIAVTNFPKKQIANFMSECLVLGVIDNGVVLLSPERKVKNGLKVC